MCVEQWCISLYIIVFSFGFLLFMVVVVVVVVVGVVLFNVVVCRCVLSIEYRVYVCSEYECMCVMSLSE
jgi:hypothetical protein